MARVRRAHLLFEKLVTAGQVVLVPEVCIDARNDTAVHELACIVSLARLLVVE